MNIKRINKTAFVNCSIFNDVNEFTLQNIIKYSTMKLWVLKAGRLYLMTLIYKFNKINYTFYFFIPV